MLVKKAPYWRLFIPGLIVAILLGSWVLPFYLMGAPASSFEELDAKSKVPYKVYALCIAVQFVFTTVLEKSFGIWGQLRFRGRMFYIVAIYFLSSVVFVISEGWFATQGYVAYGGGDAGGSFGIASIPSAVFLFLLALLITGAVAIFRKVRKSIMGIGAKRAST